MQYVQLPPRVEQLHSVCLRRVLHTTPFINKMDAIKYFNFDYEKCVKYIKMRNKDATIIPISAKSGEGIDLVADYFIERIKKHKES